MPGASCSRSPRALLLSPGRTAGAGQAGRRAAQPDGSRTRARHRRPSGTVRVNPHALWDSTASCAPAEGCGRGRPRAASGRWPGNERARSAGDRHPGRHRPRRSSPWTAWIEETLVATPSGLRVRDGRTRAAPRVGDRRPGGALVAPASHVVLDPDALDYEVEGLSTSCAPRSSTTRARPTATGCTSRSSRITTRRGSSARSAGTRRCRRTSTDFRRRIRAQQEHGCSHWREVHDKLIVHMSGVPPWLSSWEGTGTFEGGGWEDKQAHPPRDVAVWKAMIRELALVFREVEGVERYYEFWNEPDLEYWQGSLAEFLALYAATVETIREVDPEGRIGGPAVNQWDGRIHKKTGSDVLVHELIRYAAKNDAAARLRVVAPLRAARRGHRRGQGVLRDGARAKRLRPRRGGVPRDGVVGAGPGYALRQSPIAETMLGLLRRPDRRADGVVLGGVPREAGPQGFPALGPDDAAGGPARHVVRPPLLRPPGAGQPGRGRGPARCGARLVVSRRRTTGVYDLLVWRTGIEPGLAAALASPAEPRRSSNRSCARSARPIASCARSSRAGPSRHAGRTRSSRRATRTPRPTPVPSASGSRSRAPRGRCAVRGVGAHGARGEAGGRGGKVPSRARWPATRCCAS